MMEYLLIIGGFAAYAIMLFVVHWVIRVDNKRRDRRWLKYGLESQVWQLKSDKTILEDRITILAKGQPEAVRLATQAGWLELDKAKLEDRMAGLGEEQTETEDQISWLENQVRWLELDNAVLESRVTLLTIKSAA